MYVAAEVSRWSVTYAMTKPESTKKTSTASSPYGSNCQKSPPVNREPETWATNTVSAAKNLMFLYVIAESNQHYYQLSSIRANSSQLRVTAAPATKS